MKLTPTTQIAHVDGIWLETSSALRECNNRTLADLTLAKLATTPTAIPEQQLALRLEAAEVAGVEPREMQPSTTVNARETRLSALRVRRHEPLQLVEPVDHRAAIGAGRFRTASAIC